MVRSFSSSSAPNFSDLLDSFGLLFLIFPY